ncbi:MULTISPECIES: LysR family transcriptional regulator [Burkholderia]|uniref:LysR family transcriptional regulator n=1 Tax=Burkholderia TaxID=32008 RepID=UPI000863C628|nr:MULTISPECIES: LysR family transcriptional regulator [Burkholderia]AOL06487.1 LysR family transcriptional regulator [Burkholderia contaminans]ELK6464005.1 LysR family transcriptional regulator [Burkholderia contaminans]TCW63509.1 LysR family transcriptional regulator [Burkholderia sp. SRS-25]WFN12513.1 LysR family transcriptional regulator [Burkholderia contaminans]
MDLLATMRIYVRVVERGTMSGAARDLDMGQPAVSERIERLEKHLGTRLLLRSARTLTCTEEGRIFYERSKALLEAADEAVASVSKTENALDGTIRLAAPQCVGEVVLPGVLMHVRTAYPNLHIDLVLNDDIVDPVTEGVDISIRVGQLGDGGFVAHPVGTVGRRLVAAPSYLERHGPIDTTADLANHPFIRVKGVFASERLPLQRDGDALDYARIRTIMTTSHWRPMFDTIVAGGGIGVVQQPACADALAAGTLVELLPRYVIPDFALNVLVHAQRPLPPRVRAVVDLLKHDLPPLLARPAR